MPKQIDKPLLWELWADHSLQREQIAERLGISNSTLSKLQARLGLPSRPRRPRAQYEVDPTPEEIEERKREVRERNMARKRAEPWPPV